MITARLCDIAKRLRTHGHAFHQEFKKAIQGHDFRSLQSHPDAEAWQKRNGFREIGGCFLPAPDRCVAAALAHEFCGEPQRDRCARWVALELFREQEWAELESDRRLFGLLEAILQGRLSSLRNLPPLDAALFAERLGTVHLTADSPEPTWQAERAYLAYQTGLDALKRRTDGCDAVEAGCPTGEESPLRWRLLVGAARALQACSSYLPRRSERLRQSLSLLRKARKLAHDRKNPDLWARAVRAQIFCHLLSASPPPSTDHAVFRSLGRQLEEQGRPIRPAARSDQSATRHLRTADSLLNRAESYFTKLHNRHRATRSFWRSLTVPDKVNREIELELAEVALLRAQWCLVGSQSGISEDEFSRDGDLREAAGRSLAAAESRATRHGSADLVQRLAQVRAALTPVPIVHRNPLAQLRASADAFALRGEIHRSLVARQNLVEVLAGQQDWEGTAEECERAADLLSAFCDHGPTTPLRHSWFSQHARLFDRHAVALAVLGRWEPLVTVLQDGWARETNDFAALGEPPYQNRPKVRGHHARLLQLDHRLQEEIESIGGGVSSGRRTGHRVSLAKREQRVRILHKHLEGLPNNHVNRVVPDQAIQLAGELKAAIVLFRATDRGTVVSLALPGGELVGGLLRELTRDRLATLVRDFARIYPRYIPALSREELENPDSRSWKNFYCWLPGWLEELGQIFWRPLFEQFPKLNCFGKAAEVPHVILIPSGPGLGLLPFHAARLDKPVEERWCVTYSPSLYLLGLCRDRRRQRDRFSDCQFLGVANTCDVDPDQWVDVLGAWQHLQKHRCTATFFGMQGGLPEEDGQAEVATKASVIDQLGVADIACLATHAMFRLRFPWQSFFQLEDPARGLLVRDLLRMARVPHLVVAPACECAMTDPWDEAGSVASFPAVFLSAGTTGFLGSMWCNEGLTGAMLIEGFFRRLVGGMMPPAAFWEAKRSMCNEDTERHLAPFAFFGL